MENKMDEKKMKELEEMENNGEVSLDDMEDVSGGWTRQELLELRVTNPDKYKQLLEFNPELRRIVTPYGRRPFH